MKNNFWLLQIPLVILFTLAFTIDELGVQGELHNTFLRDSVFPGLRRVSTQFTDLKFKLRGPKPPKNKIVVVAVDSASLETLGRWPWHRDAISLMITSIFEAGAKVVGLDMVFSEPDKRVPDELFHVLKAKNMESLALQAETDRYLRDVVLQYKDRLVLGWATEGACQPLYEGKQYCPVTDPEALALIPQDFAKFSFSEFHASDFDPLTTPFVSVVTLIPNLADYNSAGAHSGYFNVLPDPDSFVRRMNMFYMLDRKPYPPLALEMARIGMNEQLQVKLNDKQRVTSVGFVKSGRNIPVTPQGVMEINFRGPGRTFPYVSAVDVMSNNDKLIGDELTGTFVGASKKEVFKDAYVLVGVTALGVYDMRAIPFDTNVAGVEAHANILDNILEGDSLINTSMSRGSAWLFGLMIFGAMLWAFIAAKIEAVPALIGFMLVFLTFGFIDLKVLFATNRNWNTSFFYLEMLTIFIFTLVLKYILEERDKKFIRGAFAKYVAPAVVDSILKDPSKLSVGGEKRNLTILFSDIRGFTTFSEKMDAKQLAGLLNDYLGIMTKIVFSHEGTLDKYIGDAIMAFWGAPLDQPKHATNAVKSAIGMMSALQQHRERFKQQYGITVDIGIGLNTGMVNVGNMGSDTNFAYTVIGDHVNLASRLEGLTKAYGVTIVTTRFTFDDIAQTGDALPPHRILDHVKVKGKKKAVELIQVLDRPHPEEGLKLFDEARQLYTKQEWDAATEKFNAANAILAPSPTKRDGPCEVYLERCAEFKKNPPGAEWDGSWEMHSK